MQAINFGEDKLIQIKQSYHFHKWNCTIHLFAHAYSTMLKSESRHTENCWYERHYKPPPGCTVLHNGMAKDWNNLQGVFQVKGNSSWHWNHLSESLIFLNSKTKLKRQKSKKYKHYSKWENERWNVDFCHSGKDFHVLSQFWVRLWKNVLDFSANKNGKSWKGEIIRMLCSPRKRFNEFWDTLLKCVAWNGCVYSCITEHHLDDTN